MLSNKNFKKAEVYLLGGFITIAVLIWVPVLSFSQDYVLEVNFFDIGQGDAIFIEAPGGSQVLIDGGPDSTILEKLGQELPFYDREIDLVILTHPDADHLSGLIEVLKRYKIDAVLITGVASDTNVYKEWQTVLEKEGAKIIIAQAGQRVWLGEDIYLDILYPFQNLEDKVVSNTNNSSIVSRLVFGENSFLFTGDAEFAAEYDLVSRDIDIDSDILKIGHHGSKNSTSQRFLEAITPEIAVIQAGKNNKYGHPHEDVLKRLKGINILRTDLDGDIEILSDGINIGFSQ